MLKKINDALKVIKAKKKQPPRIGLILGSGLGPYVESIEEKVVIDYSDIPHFLNTTVDGHVGRLVLGKIEGTHVAVMQGRVHYYEGHSMEEVSFPARVLCSLGIETLILTNAAGGVNESFKPGELVVIKDHINMMGNNPLIGPNVKDLGPRFPDMTYAYDRELIDIIKKSGESILKKMNSGVYCALSGPTYETPAEIRMLRTFGADMVGMSTVPETIIANHMGVKVAGISCITNMGAGITGNRLNHEEVKEQAIQVMDSFTKLLSLVIKEIGAR